MSYKILLVGSLVLLALGLSIAVVDAQRPPPGVRRSPAALAGTGTAFTYQGQLKNGGALVNGACDFEFGLWDDPSVGTQYGATQTVSSLVVTNGLFTTQIDFGSVFTGTARYLQSAVRCPSGVGITTTLSPRQTLTPAPYALALPGLYTQQNATSPNVIGGYSGNVITPTLVGATISGGGSSGAPNRAWANYATVGGGVVNTASGDYATVGGGNGNTASNTYATVGGGNGNTASGYYATVGGGGGNTASGGESTVPGGVFNTAAGNYSFAAGNRAKANNQGAFVWADSTNADFASTGNNQFLIRANGGVGINTSNPGATLEVAGGDVKISNAGSGIIFPDASKQTSAASKGLGYVPNSSFVYITTTGHVVGTLAVPASNTGYMYMFGGRYALLCNGGQLTLYLYIDGGLFDSVDAQCFGSTDTRGVLSQLGVASPGAGTHVFELRAYSTVTDTSVILLDGGRFFVMKW